MRFRVKVLPSAKNDVQDAIKWYNKQQTGLGRRFHSEVKVVFEYLKTIPFFQFRYDCTRCLPLRKFPFMVHFIVDEKEKQVIVHAVFRTSENPDKWNKKT